MQRGFWLSVVFCALVGLGVASSCTQDFGQFVPGEGGSGPSCPSGQKSCDGKCVDVNDPAFGCGALCGACSLVNATAVCEGGACAVGECNAGFTDCDKNPVTGCESDITTDTMNCGACGAPCTFANAESTCAAGQCSMGQCSPGFDDCDKNPANGCEGVLTTDPANCGACDTPCTEFEACQNGACVLNPCAPGTGDCNTDPSDGCEAQLGTTDDCGFCGDGCAFTNATPACNAGKCEIQSCDNGFDNCDNDPATGCEADLNNAATCGDCNTACPNNPANGTSTCSNGKCTVMCDNGFGDCNNDPADGCETNINTDTDNCGGCGRACSNANVNALNCAAGLCTSTCSGGFSNCAQPPAPGADDGCEANTQTDVNNCGGCGRACSGTNVASKSCTAGLCDSTCDLGFGNCNRPAAPTNDNGCEMNVQTSDNNCGGCGNACSMLGTSNTTECDRPQGAQPVQKTCGCSGNNECQIGGGSGTCNTNTGVCTCNGTQCAPGEGCINMGGMNVCSCATEAGGAACAGAGMLCCGAPAGCKDVYADPQNCGACGHACAAGFICTGMAPQTPSCRCDADADCNAGTPGTCNGTGVCVCGANTCAAGERCLPNGQCG